MADDGIMRTHKKIVKSADVHPDVILIVCRRRKNQPQILPAVCEKRCTYIKNCPDYRRYIQPGVFDVMKEKRP